MAADPIRERVLLVEDDDATAEIILSSVARNSSPNDARSAFSLTRVATLTEAQEALTTEEYGAVLLDLNLPDSAGLDTVHAILEAAPHLAVIVLTCADDSDMALEAMRLGAQDYLFKGRIDGALIVRSLLYAISRNRAESRLRHAQQMEALGRLAGSVAHDFNNLLTIIIGNAETAHHDVVAGSEVDGSLGEIRQAAQRAATLTARLLALGRKQQFQPRLLDLGETVSGMSEMLRRVIGSDTAFKVTLPSDHLLVHADPLQLEQLLLNLALNARDADPAPRHVSISVSALPPNAVGAWRPRLGSGRYALLTVTDDGAPIAADVLRRMYEPFAPTGGGAHVLAPPPAWRFRSSPASWSRAGDRCSRNQAPRAGLASPLHFHSPQTASNAPRARS